MRSGKKCCLILVTFLSPLTVFDMSWYFFVSLELKLEQKIQHFKNLSSFSLTISFTVQVPTILNSLQRSVQAVLVGKIQIQDWFSNGIKKAALMHKWPLKEISVDEDDQCLLQSDGFFLYLLCKDGLYKIGSGYSGTVRVMWLLLV